MKIACSLIMILMLWVSSAWASFSLCFITDVECVASKILPGYDSGNDSIKEWSSGKGKMVARNNYILTKLRFDEQSLIVLQNGNPYGIEIEAVISGDNYSSVSLDWIYHTFPSSAQAGQDTQVCDFVTNGDGTKVFALHILNASAIEKDTDYYVIFYLNNPLPASGVTIVSNLQITIDIDYDRLLSGFNIADAFPYLNQFQHYVLETDGHEKFAAYPDKLRGVCWDNKKSSYLCSGSEDAPNGGTSAASARTSDAPLVSMASSIPSNYGGYLPPIGLPSQPISGPRVDLRPDFDIYDTAGHETSANCDNCSGKPVVPGQIIRPKLWIQVSNNDAGNFKRNSDSDSIEGPVWWKIEGKTGWNLLSSGEYTISKLDQGEQISETHSLTVPNYPGDILAMKACVDGDDEIWEESESSSGHDIDSPDQSGTTNNCSRTERSYIEHPNYMPTGTIESFDCSKIVGWAKDQNTASSLIVQVYFSNPDGSNMQFIENATASIDRTDLGGRYGLEWTVPDSLKDGVSRSINFYAVNIPVGTNFLLGTVPLACSLPLVQPPSQLRIGE